MSAQMNSESTSGVAAAGPRQLCNHPYTQAAFTKKNKTKQKKSRPTI